MSLTPGPLYIARHCPDAARPATEAHRNEMRRRLGPRPFQARPLSHEEALVATLVAEAEREEFAADEVEVPDFDEGVRP